MTSCLFSGCLFACAGVVSLSMWKRTHTQSLLRTEYLQSALSGFAIGAVAMPAAAYVRDQVLFASTKGLEYCYQQLKGSFPDKKSNTKTVEVPNSLRRELDKISYTLDFTVNLALRAVPALLLYSIWGGTLYPMLLALTIKRDEGIKISAYLRSSLRWAAIRMAFGLIPGIFVVVGAYYVLLGFAEPVLTILYTLMVFWFAIRSGLKLRSFLNPRAALHSKRPTSNLRYSTKTAENKHSDSDKK